MNPGSRPGVQPLLQTSGGDKARLLTSAEGEPCVIQLVSSRAGLGGECRQHESFAIARNERCENRTERAGPGVCSRLHGPSGTVTGSFSGRRRRASSASRRGNMARSTRRHKERAAGKDARSTDGRSVSRTNRGQESWTSSGETRRGDAMLNSTECKTDRGTLGKLIFEKWPAVP